jgi:hypothetical protein
MLSDYKVDRHHHDKARNQWYEVLHNHILLLQWRRMDAGGIVGDVIIGVYLRVA